MSCNCTDIVDKKSTTEIISLVFSALLLLSEILPFVSSIKANGIAQAIHMFVFHRDDEPTLIRVSKPNYQSI